MSSGSDDPDGTEVIPDSEVLQTEYENAKERLTDQQATLRTFSEEGMGMFRLLLLLVAAPIALLGAFEPELLLEVGNKLTSDMCAVTLDGCRVSVRDFSLITGVLFLLTTVLNVTAAGYEARGVHNTTNSEDIHHTLKSEYSIGDFRLERLEVYRDRILHNDKIIHMEESLLALGKFTLWLTTYGAAALTYVMASNNSIAFGWLVGVFVLSAVPLFVQYYNAPEKYLEADGQIWFNPLYNLEFGSEQENDGHSEPEEDDEPEREQKDVRATANSPSE